MRQMIFADPAARQRLETILHPLVEQALEEQTREAAIRSGRWLPSRGAGIQLRSEERGLGVSVSAAAYA